MIWGEVSQRADRVAIVGSGPTSMGLERETASRTGAFVIAINSAVLHVQANAFFTCDPSLNTRPLLRTRIRGVQYYAAVPPEYGTRKARNRYHRIPAEYGVTYLHRLEGPGPLKHRPGLSEDKRAIHTGNSAYGALGLAYLMGAKKIALFGVDGWGGYAWGSGGPYDLSHLPRIFETAVEQLTLRSVQVVNGSLSSRVTCFERMTQTAALDWIRG